MFPTVQLPQSYPELLYSYAHLSQPCPVLLPLMSRAAAEAATSGRLSVAKLAWLGRSAEALISAQAEGGRGGSESCLEPELIKALADLAPNYKDWQGLHPPATASPDKPTDGWITVRE